jgi:signal transduction histidine kinase/CheY-like chemotaxis protein
MLGVPLFRRGKIVGVITVRRREPGRFSNQQAKLIEAFADQAVIAIENVRLFNETKEALERAEAANRAKSRFLAAASHDLRQPAHALSVFAAALSMRSLDEASQEIVQHMNTAVHALATQLDALLDISKLDAGVVHAKREAVGLPGLLEKLHHEVRPIALGKGLETSLECPSDGAVDTDPVQFERILRNLLDNAVKYTEIGVVRLEARRDGDCFIVAVVDSGPGIPESEHQRIFEEFYQLNNPERDRARGLGLGLAIVRRLVDLLGVELRLASAPGKGSRFELRLPAAAAAHVPAHAPSLRPIPAALEVLVLDDEPHIRLAMKSLLEEMGCRATVAESAEEAVNAARITRPELVLADLRLRGANGIEAIRAIRALYPGMPALLLSGDIAPERLREAETAGIALLHKPVPAETLKRAIAQAIFA